MPNERHCTICGHVLTGTVSYTARGIGYHVACAAPLPRKKPQADPWPFISSSDTREREEVRAHLTFMSSLMMAPGEFVPTVTDRQMLRRAVELLKSA